MRIFLLISIMFFLNINGYCILRDTVSRIDNVVIKNINLKRKTPRTKSEELRNFDFKRNIQLTVPHTNLTLPFVGDVHLGKNTTHRNYLLSSSISTRYFFGNETFSRFLADIHLEADIRILRDTSKSPKFGQNIPWDNSMPVRTPSIKPGITLYYNLYKKSENEAIIKQFLDNNSNHQILRGKYLSLKVFHNSNGQDGKHTNKYLYDIVKVRDGVKLDTTVFNSSFNLYNGNFAVDIIIEPGITFTKNTFNRSSEIKYNQISTLYVGYESGTLGVSGNFGEEKLLGNYGLEKLKIKWQRVRIDRTKEEARTFEKNRIIFTNSLVLNNISSKNIFRRINTELAFQFNPFTKKGPYFKNNNLSFLICGGWKGQDDYNVYFQDSFPYFKLGLAMGLKADRNPKRFEVENFSN